MPVSGRLGPDQAQRALREAGFSAGLVQRRVAELHHLLLPAVLLLKEGDACIVVARHHDDPPALRHRDARSRAPCLHGSAKSPSWRPSTPAWRWSATPPGQCAPARPRRAAGARARQPLAVGHDAALHAVLPLGPAGSLAEQRADAGHRPGHDRSSTTRSSRTRPGSRCGRWPWPALALVFDLLARQLRAYLIDLAGRKADLIVGSVLFRQTLGLRMEQRPDSAGAYSAPPGPDRGGARLLCVGHLVGGVGPALHPGLRGHDLCHRRPTGLGAGGDDAAAAGRPALIQGSLRRATMGHMQQTGRSARCAGGGGGWPGRPQGRRRAGALPAPLRRGHRGGATAMLRSRTPHQPGP
jgi:hypothetical protein